MSSNKILVTLDHGIKRITFNRPERLNSVDFEMFELFAAAIHESIDDDSRVIILSGTGDAFCAGADLMAAGVGDLASLDVAAHLREHTNKAILSMRELAKPVIARVHGPAVGIGFSYALACDMIIASEQAVFGQGFIKIGLMPDGGSTFFLPRLVGYAKAYELMSLGEQINAGEAWRLGLINRVVAWAELDATINKIAERLAQSPALALANIKEALNRPLRAELAGALDFEAINQNACFHSTDFLEGVTAFMQKRKPVFGQPTRAE